MNRAVVAAGAAACALAVAGCAGPASFLGARMPASCRTSTDANAAGEDCVGWIYDRLAVVATDDEYVDPALRGYVATVAARIARANHLPVPFVRILDRTSGAPAFARPGNYVYLTRDMLAVLGSEAELAGVVAHEMAHQASGHTADLVDSFTVTIEDDLKHQRSRDDESTADELAVGYLVAAGYEPDGMRTALIALDRAATTYAAVQAAKAIEVGADGRNADGEPVADVISGAAVWATPEPEPVIDDHHRYPPVIDEDDPDHPAVPERLARVTMMVAGKPHGEIAVARFLDHIDGIALGTDPRRGALVGSTWTAARVRLAVDLPPGWQLDDQDEKLVASAPKHEVTVWSIGKAWGDAVADTLSDRKRRTIAGHPAVIGMSRAVADDHRRSELQVAMDSPRPSGGSAVAVITVGAHAVAIYVSGADDTRQLADVLGRVRAMTAKEIAAARPFHLRLVPAPRADRAGALQTELCSHPDRPENQRLLDGSSYLEDQARWIENGEPVKCVEN